MNYRASTTTVVLLAAGRGKRMLPLTRHKPKPLLIVGEHSLIEHHLLKLKQQGFHDIVINLAYFADQIRDKLGDGSDYGLQITYSDESETGALETAGGLQHAQKLIASDPFIVINADTWTDYPYAKILYPLNNPARLVMVENPDHNIQGDFSFKEGMSKGSLLCKTSKATQSHTFSGIALYHRSLFENLAEGKQALAPIFNKLIDQQMLEGEEYRGRWFDVGTPDRLIKLDHIIQTSIH